MNGTTGGGDWVAVLTSASGVEDHATTHCLRALKAQGARTPEVRRIAGDVVEIGFRAPRRPAVPITVPDPVDVNILPTEGRAKAVFIADMDSTMIPVECIDELADYAGVKPRVAAITEAAMRGELDFEQAVDARVALLRGLPVTVLQDCYDTRISLNPGAQALLSGLNGAGMRTALVSGGFTFFTERVAAAAGFQSHQANVLEEDGGHLTGTVRRPILGREAKALALQELCRERGQPPEAAVAIGDGANDLDMIRMAGLGIAYKAKPALKAGADAILDHSDLTAVLALLGLAAAAS